MIIRYYRRVSHGFPKEASATAPAANGNWWNASICKGRFAVTKVVGDTGTRGSIQDMYIIRSLGSTNHIPKWYVLILGLPWFTTLICNCQKTCFDNDFTCSKVNTSAALKWADRRHPAQSPGGFDQETWHWLTGQRKSESQLELPFGITIGTSGITFWFDQQHMKAIGRNRPRIVPWKPLLASICREIYREFQLQCLITGGYSVSKLGWLYLWHLVNLD